MESDSAGHNPDPKPVKKYLTKEQKSCLVHYMADNVDFANNRFQSLQGKELQRQKWAALSSQLNSLGGASKTPEQWELCWRDLKQKTKSKWLDIKNRQSGVNGLLKKKRDILTDLETMILSVMQRDTLDGDGATQEGGFNEPTLPVDLDADEESLVQNDNVNIEFIDEEIGSLLAGGSGTPSMITGTSTNSTLQPATTERVYVSEPTDTPRVAPRTVGHSRERQLGRGRRYSATGIQNMETQIFKCLENMREDKKESMKRKHELQEKMLALEERKLAIKQQKVEALNSISENIQGLLNGFR